MGLQLANSRCGDIELGGIHFDGSIAAGLPGSDQTLGYAFMVSIDRDAAGAITGALYNYVMSMGRQTCPWLDKCICSILLISPPHGDKRHLGLLHLMCYLECRTSFFRSIHGVDEVWGEGERMRVTGISSYPIGSPYVAQKRCRPPWCSCRVFGNALNPVIYRYPIVWNTLPLSNGNVVQVSWFCHGD